jgi:opacity protein-like surface antigen
MPHRIQASWGAAAVVAALAAISTPAAAHAADFEQPFPAGVACTFAITVTGTNDNRVMEEFTDAEGNVRFLAAGRGSDLTFSNDETGATFSLKGNGSVTTTTVSVEGSTTVQSTGHNVLILFPTDIPAGPSTTLYTGRVTYTVDTEGVFRLVSASGRTLDICAELD